MTDSQDLLVAAHQGATLVTASRRLARTLRQRYNKWRRSEGDPVWETPEILPWEPWLDKLWHALLFRTPARAGGVLLSALQERALWRRIVERASADDALLDSAATADTAADSWALLRAWELDPRALAGAGSDDTAAFLRWADEFERACADGGWLDRASLPERLTPALGALPLPRELLLAGFEELSPQQRRFVDACRAEGVQVRLADLSGAPAASAVRVGFRDREEELRAAAGWARSLIESGAGGPVGIVVESLGSLRDTVERIFTEILHPAASLPAGPDERVFNISAGRPLRTYPVVRAALSILDLDPTRNEMARVGRLLRSRFVGGSEAEWTARAALDARLRGYGLASLSTERLSKLAGRENLPLLARSLERWRTVRASLASQQKPSEWSRSFSLLLEAFGWPGDRGLDSREYQVVGEWNGILSELARLDAVVPDLRYRDALQELKRAAANAIFQPEGGNAPIQILGLLEASGLRFEHLWIAGLHDDAWPASARPDPFLPTELQRHLQMPHASPERELQFSQAITDRLLGSAERIVVSYPMQDADGELGPSPLILGVNLVAVEDLRLADVPLHRTLIRVSSRLESVVDAQGPPVPPEVWQPGGARVFEFQAACPFRAFAQLRLGAQALESPEPGLDERCRGILVHSALEKLWSELGSRDRLVSLAADERRDLIKQAVKDATEKFAKRRGEWPEKFGMIEALRLETLLANWLKVEAGRAAFEVVQPESEQYAELGGVRFRVRLDRVDRVPDGRHVIVDYKTGNAALAGWDGPRPDTPQLPLYAVTHTERVAGMLFGQVRVGTLRLLGLGDPAAVAEGIDAGDPEQRRAEWRDVLVQLGEEFRAGRAAVDPKNGAKTCRICKMTSLCRIHEASVAAQTGEEGDD